MAATRDAIELIHRDLELALRALVDDDTLSDEDADGQFRALTNEAVWESIYTLANHIDSLRAG